MQRSPVSYTAFHRNDPVLQQLLPPFVLAHLESLRAEAIDVGGAPEDTYEHILYAELFASIDAFCHDVRRHLLLWIGHHDYTLNHLAIGGSACWVKPDNHALSFEAIPAHLLPAVTERNASIWWLLRKPEEHQQAHLRVYRIQIVPEAQVPDGFPNHL